MGAMKSMKAMKAMKAMKSMRRRKAMKVSKIAKGKRAKSSVFRGTKVKTVGGLKKENLTKNKYGKVVSKKASANAKKGASYKWAIAVQKGRKALGVKGFCAIGGKSSQGQALLKKA